MRCKCGFENAADARFCGRCRSSLGNVPANAVPNAVASSAAPPVATGSGRAPARPLPRARIAIVATLVVIAAAGYWWMNRHAIPAAYFGVWNKVETGGYVRVIISGTPEKPRVHLWGAGLPQEWDYGEDDAFWDGSALTFRQDNQTREFRLTLDRSANLQLNCHVLNGKDCVTMSYTKSTPARR